MDELDEARPSMAAKLGTTDDWTITVWCENCQVWHHYFAKKLAKKYDVWELQPHPKRKRKNQNGELVYSGRFDSIDDAVEALEDELAGSDEEEDDEDEDGED